mmetsp:Transcript_20254/g.34913  ORF Transcript_20254/g.34913 Transcript_20254/m.34913 type:complete len:219 (-) Transcript_20254:70-726(-)
MAAAFYLFFAVFNYLCYGKNTASIVFDNMGDSIANTLVKTSLCLMLMCNFPLSVFPVHQSIELALGLARNSPTAKPPSLEMAEQGNGTANNTNSAPPLWSYQKASEGGEQEQQQYATLPEVGIAPSQRLSRVVVIVLAGVAAYYSGGAFALVVAIGGGFNGIMAFVNPPLCHLRLRYGTWSAMPLGKRLLYVILVGCGVVGGGGALWQGLNGLINHSQ